MQHGDRQFMLLIDSTKVFDRVIDVYQWVNEDLNTAEVILLGNSLINLAKRRANDVEIYYQNNRSIEESNNDHSLFY